MYNDRFIGCWFCRKEVEEGDDYHFTFEFDCDVHISCVRRQLVEDPYHPEAVMIADELDRDGSKWREPESC